MLPQRSIIKGMITRTCAQCGIEYKTYPSIRKRYCSRKCASAAKVRGTCENCAQCGEKFWKFRSRPDASYCSKSCAISARNLTDANPAYSRDITGENNPMYGKGMKGSDNPMYGMRNEKAPRWTGGRRIRKDGYIVIVAPDDHPYPSETKASGLKYILEHRLVMETELGRYLEPEEVVHHKDENPSNNNIDNLQLFASQADHIREGH